MQSPMLSAPLKRSIEIDWSQPLKQDIRQTYGEDPEEYAKACADLNLLRKGAIAGGKDIIARDSLYKYYGQLELLDLRFQVDEDHIKIPFTW